jgi:hypothetical protein
MKEHTHLPAIRARHPAGRKYDCRSTQDFRLYTLSLMPVLFALDQTNGVAVYHNGFQIFVRFQGVHADQLSDHARLP